MESLNTVLLLLALVAFVMYLKNLFDIREGVLSDSRSRTRRRCPGGYKKYPRLFQTHTKRNSKERRLIVKNMNNRMGKKVSGEHLNNLVRRRKLRIYDYECNPTNKSLGGKKKNQKRANAAKALIGAGVKSFSYTA